MQCEARTAQGRRCEIDQRRLARIDRSGLLVCATHQRHAKPDDKEDTMRSIDRTGWAEMFQYARERGVDFHIYQGGAEIDIAKGLVEGLPMRMDCADDELGPLLMALGEYQRQNPD